jgi:hypothetical protein
MKTSIKKGKANGKDAWILSVHYNGARQRKYFKTYVEAKKFDILEWLGEHKKIEVCGDETLLSVARDLYLTEYTQRNENKAKPTQKGLETTADRVDRFLRFYGRDRAVSEVTVPDFKTYVLSGKWSETTRKQYGGAVSIFMAWCAKAGFGQNPLDWYHKTNPELAWEKGKKFSRLPGICTPEQTKALLLTMPEKYRPALAIMFFTGIRPEQEMNMLRYSDIRHGKTIHLQAERTKTGRERWIKPPENLWQWVPKRVSGNLMPSYGAFNQSRRRAARRAFGWTEGTARKEGFDYPANGARHSFGSYGYWISFEWALDTMGHMSSETFLRNYKNSRVTIEESNEYFSI